MGSFFRDPVCNYPFAGIITALDTITKNVKEDDGAVVSTDERAATV